MLGRWRRPAAGNPGDAFSDILGSCSGLTSLRITLPGHWDTKYLFRWVSADIAAVTATLHSHSRRARCQ